MTPSNEAVTLFLFHVLLTGNLAVGFACTTLISEIAISVQPLEPVPVRVVDTIHNSVASMILPSGAAHP